MRIHARDLGPPMYLQVHGLSFWKDFCRIVSTEFESGELSGRAQSLARNGHPSADPPRLERRTKRRTL